MKKHEWIEKATAKELQHWLRVLQKEDAYRFKHFTFLQDGKLVMSEHERQMKNERDSEIAAITAKLRTLVSGF